MNIYHRGNKFFADHQSAEQRKDIQRIVNGGFISASAQANDEQSRADRQ